MTGFTPDQPNKSDERIAALEVMVQQQSEHIAIFKDVLALLIKLVVTAEKRNMSVNPDLYTPDMALSADEAIEEILGVLR